MKNTLPEKIKDELGQLFPDRDLRIDSWLSLKREEWVEEAIKEERKRIEKLTDDFVPCDNKKHTIALLKLLNSLHSTP